MIKTVTTEPSQKFLGSVRDAVERVAGNAVNLPNSCFREKLPQRTESAFAMPAASVVSQPPKLFRKRKMQARIDQGCG